MGFVRRAALRAIDRGLSIAGYRLERGQNPLSSPFAQERPLYHVVPRELVAGAVAEERAPEPLDPVIIEDILEFFRAFPPFYDARVEPALRIGGAWKALLERTRARQLACIHDRNREGLKELVEGMFYNELVSGLWNHGPYRAGPLSRPFVGECDAFERISDLPRERLATNRDFDLWGLKTGAGIVKYTDPQHGVQATHVLRAIELLRPGSPTTVLDLGSGFGGLAEKLAAWARTEVRVVLVDIPLNLTTAYAYLARSRGRGVVRLVTEPDHLEDAAARFLLAPTALLPALRGRLTHGVLHNGKSFSEMDAATVARYLELLVNDRVDVIIETNANRVGSENFGGHREVPSRAFPIPDSHPLLSRFQDSRPGRYVTSVYLNRARLAPR